MALTKSDQSVANTTVAAGTTEGSPVASSAITVNYGLSGVLQITNGGSGPTAGAQVAIQVTADGTNWRYWAGPFQAGTAASTTYQFPFSVPVDLYQARAVAFGNTTNDVTLNVRISRTDSL